MKQQKEINEFINYVRDDLMEIYQVDKEKADSLIHNYKLKRLIDKHGELVAHYPSEELARMVFESKVLQNH